MSQEFRDLAKLLRKRTRDAATTVTQLVDDDGERAALLASVAIDFINGASVMLANDDEALGDLISDKEALGNVLMLIFSSIGVDLVTSSLKAARSESTPRMRRDMQ